MFTAPLLSSCRMRPLSAASVGSVMVQDRLNELVRLFKGRTERQKDRLVDPDESEEESPTACKSWLLHWLYIVFFTPLLSLNDHFTSDWPLQPQAKLHLPLPLHLLQEKRKRTKQQQRKRMTNMKKTMSLSLKFWDILWKFPICPNFPRCPTGSEPSLSTVSRPASTPSPVSREMVSEKSWTT